jgi:chemotaxis protein MotB
VGYRTRQKQAEETAGAPEWMVTFSDCMTLLLTFFVLLLSFSSFDENVFRKLKLIFNKEWPSISSQAGKDGFLPAKLIESREKLGEGSEKPTLLEGWDDHLKEETEPSDFRRRKVFLIPSNKIFWGKGRVISSEGRGILAVMGSYLKEVPNRVVISENGLGPDMDDIGAGLPRAWAVMEYLTTKQGLEKERLSLSAAGVTASQKDGQASMGSQAGRLLEIVLLERSICN